MELTCPGKSHTHARKEERYASTDRLSSQKLSSRAPRLGRGGRRCKSDLAQKAKRPNGGNPPGQEVVTSDVPQISAYATRRNCQLAEEAHTYWGVCAFS